MPQDRCYSACIANLGTFLFYGHDPNNELFVFGITRIFQDTDAAVQTHTYFGELYLVVFLCKLFPMHTRELCTPWNSLGSAVVVRL